MNLHPTEEQTLLRDTLAKLLSQHSTPQRVRAAEAAGGFDAALWDELVALGLPALRVPESADGAGLGLLDAAILAEEAGRHLCSAPLVEAMVAHRLLAEFGRTARLPTLALFDAAERPSQLVPGGAIADAVLCLDGDAVRLVKGGGATPANLGSQPIARLELKGQGEVLAQGANARTSMLAAIEEWKLLSAAMLVGMSAKALENAAAYAGERMQFGKKIGSFQGVSHPIANSAADIDAARLLVWRTIWAIARGRAEAGANIAQSWWFTGRAADRAVTRALRTFGGYGLSLEYDAQLYFRRAKALALMAGDPELELQRAGDRLWAKAPAALPDAGTVALDFSWGEKGERFAEETRAFFQKNLTPALRAHAHFSTDGHDDAFQKKLAEAGLLYPAWPVEFGGQGRDLYEDSAMAEVYEEFGWTRILPGTSNMGARAAMQFGSDELKQEVLPRMARGEIHSCLGFSEPGAGSDMYATRTRAVQADDGSGDWIINGQKIFTTGAHQADYVLLLTRTDPEAQKHRGLTLFLAPLKTVPGFMVQAVHTLQDERTNITFYTDMRIPDRYRLGPVNRGIDVMTAAMSLEHGGLGYQTSQQTMIRAAIHWAEETGRIEEASVRQRLARFATHELAANLLCRRAVWGKQEGIPNIAWGPMSKLFSTDTYMKDSADLVALAAPDSLLRRVLGREPTPLEEIEAAHRHSMGSTIYGGTLEVHRSIVAEHALGMPRSRD